ncbi:serine/threonine protein kinase, FIKK family [Plasmodium sp. gorilla clade G2]|uniref:serine/threonine protein kinase, FIKK family n=1 Tax=Plasmodium sp. gorilla clade G2 TaxID=880535 RepID=UPI000D2727BB|nr:serine/threonine protein kinase, FIKK family [Plasmodium sp. gorilla clade G2]SOV20446.1 serine/threonine protein kinase, FIKK family [Plasmodium sp. gorilla clade G2]
MIYIKFPSYIFWFLFLILLNLTFTDRSTFEYIRLIDIYFKNLHEYNGINKLCCVKSCNKIFDQRILGEEESIYESDDENKKTKLTGLINLSKILNKIKKITYKDENLLKSGSNLNIKENKEFNYKRKVKNNDINDNEQYIAELKDNNHSKNIYNWMDGYKLMVKMLGLSNNFSINGVKYSDWELIPIATISYNKEKFRVQEMFKTVITSKNDENKSNIGLFIKKIPIDIWLEQLEMMELYNGEYLVNAENYVMEASILAFLNEYYQGLIAPKLYKILYEENYEENNKENIFPQYMFNEKNELDINHLHEFKKILKERINKNVNGYIVIVSELYGQNVLEYMGKIKKEHNIILSEREKKRILYECLKLLIKLHNVGIAHLDISKENILMTEDYKFLLCDFCKSTPIYTKTLRHVKEVNHICLFESCVPKVGKISYAPPECIQLRKKYEEMGIKNPLSDLNYIKDIEERRKYYFNVISADIYMLGVLFLRIWNNKPLWLIANIEEDENFSKIFKEDMNIDLFIITKKWPKEFKKIIQQLLLMTSRKNLSLKELSKNPWWKE